MRMYKNFTDAIDIARHALPQTPESLGRWQGVDVSDKPEMAMHEALFYSFQVPMPGEDLDVYRQDIKPNLPWADDHFEKERVSGSPINPGSTWKDWPYGHSAANFLDKNGQFNHSYAERYWPKYAGTTSNGWIYDIFPDDPSDRRISEYVAENFSPLKGVRYEYGDLNNLIGLLSKDPTTRQAYLPVWFPEDTGDVHMDRRPCTLGYHFIMRNNQLHVVYYIRSCDFVRHFRDDIYLTARLTLWVLDQCREKNPLWKRVKPGLFTMHISSLHCFRNDYGSLNT